MENNETKTNDSTVNRCGFIALVGAPNAGKSTLLNRVVGSKISIVTPKVQTTRTRVTGIMMHKQSQLIFIDTPGIFKPQKTLDKAMVRAAWNGAGDADIVALLVDARKGLGDDTKMILQGLKQRQGRTVLLINKIDTVSKDQLLTLTSLLTQDTEFEQVFMISAKNGDGVDDVLNYFSEHVPEGIWMYPEDQISDVPMRMLAAEVTREKLMLSLQNELPYQLMVDTEKWEDRKPTRRERKGSILINQVVYVSNENHKRIVVGKQGQGLKKVGEMARKELAWMMDKPVHLFLFVKVAENWQNKRDHYQMIGLDFPS